MEDEFEGLADSAVIRAAGLRNTRMWKQCSVVNSYFFHLRRIGNTLYQIQFERAAGGATSGTTSSPRLFDKLFSAGWSD